MNNKFHQVLNAQTLSATARSALLAIVTTLNVQSAYATAPPAEMLKTIEDSALRACVQQSMQEEGVKQLGALRILKCHNRGIQSTKGVEQLSGLNTLSLFGNRIRRLESPLPASLETMNIARNALTTLSLNDMPKLKKVFVFGNRLTHITLNNLPNLALLRSNDNQLTHFHYQALPQLEKIYLFNNQLENFDIHQLPALRYMDCRQNPMPDELYDDMDRMEQVTFLHDGNADDW